MRNRHGQAALEFLITYGWAILAVIVALGAISYYTGFYVHMLPNRCDMSAPFSCVEQKVSDDGSVIMVLRNGAGYDLQDVQVTVWCNQQESEQTSATFPLVKDQDEVNGSFVALSCPVTSRAFKAQLFVTYTQSGSTTSHTVTGDIRTVVEHAEPSANPGPAPPVHPPLD